MPRLELFPFRYLCPRTGKWHRARYVAERHVIAERYPDGWEIIGPAEVRNFNPHAQYFSPHPKIMSNAELRRYELVPHAHLPVEEPPPSEPPQPEKEPGKAPPVKEPPETDPPVKEPPSVEPATLAAVERFLVLVFLRRYVTYCARRGRYAAMNGASRLYSDLKGTPC